jgi:hypothetical protein
MEPHLIEDCKQWKIPRTDWIIQGFSQAGHKTGFAIFSLKMLFDAGLPTMKILCRLHTRILQGWTAEYPCLVEN